MKRLNYVLAAITLVASVLMIQSCSTDNTANDNAIVQPSGETQNDVMKALAQKVGAEEAYKAVYGSAKNGVRDEASIQAAITYSGILCSGIAQTGSVGRFTFVNANRWKYYKFYAVAGATIDITVKRTACGMDPGFALYAGTTTDAAGVTLGNGGPNMTWIKWLDDGTAPSTGCGCYFDPKGSYLVPTTGWYTVGVFDVLGCGSGITYSILATGVSCDTDGDGIMDWDDAYPNSDMSTTINFDGCDSEVQNHVFANGATMMDLLKDCTATASTHGDFVSCVTAITNDWKKDGLISGADKGAIQGCASSSSLP